MMIAFGLACLAVYAINAWAAADAKPRYADAAGVSSLLCLSYGVSNALVGLYGLPDAILAFPVIDAIFAWMIWRAWRRHHRVWKILLLSMIVAQLALHCVAIFVWQIQTLSSHGLYAYAAMLNATFALQLLIVGGAGAGHVLGRIFSHLFSHRRPLASRGHE